VPLDFKLGSAVLDCADDCASAGVATWVVVRCRGMVLRGSRDARMELSDSGTQVGLRFLFCMRIALAMRCAWSGYGRHVKVARVGVGIGIAACRIGALRLIPSCAEERGALEVEYWDVAQGGFDFGDLAEGEHRC